MEITDMIKCHPHKGTMDECNRRLDTAEERIRAFKSKRNFPQ